MRIGFGSDIHVLEKGGELTLGGIAIPYTMKLKGHSDADVVLHAVTDAILGALAEPDIGTIFSDKDPQWKGVDSAQMLEEAVKRMTTAGYKLSNLDITIHAEQPKLGPHKALMAKNIASILKCEINQVSVKAKTGEGVDAVGMKMAIKSECIVLMEKA